MYKGFYNLTSAMLTQGKHLDVISNNMANIATTGYKADRFTQSTFGEVMWSMVGNKEKAYTELGGQSWITAPSQLYTDYSQGPLEQTDLPLNFAIEGNGYFAVETDNGRMYTRNGSFTLDNEGYLTLPGEGRVLSRAGNPIRLQTDQIRVDSLGGMYTEGGTFLGMVGVFDFGNAADMAKNARSLFDAGGQAVPTAATLRNGMIERSNVDMVQQLTEMIQAERAYQSAAEVIKIYDEVIQRSNSDVGRL